MRSRTILSTCSPKWGTPADEFVLFFEEPTAADDAICITVMDEERLTRARDAVLGRVRIPLLEISAARKEYELIETKKGGRIVVEVDIRRGKRRKKQQQQQATTEAAGEPAPSASGGGALSLAIPPRPSLSPSPPPDEDEDSVIEPMGADLLDSPADTEPTTPSGSASEIPTLKQARGMNSSWASLPAAGAFGANRSMVFYSLLAGVVTTGGSESYRQFMCYEVEMRGVAEVFGQKRQRWNEAYAKARQIFGANPVSLAVRGVIMMQHGSLYRRTAWRSAGGVLRSGDDFLRLFNYGVRDRSPVTFTYVLLDNTFNFSETGASFGKNFMSKHAMHANARRSVRYAGEFFVHLQDDGSRVFVIDNNSGTYAPDPADLPALRQLFVQNFPGLQVEALERTDPRLEELKAVQHALQEKQNLQQSQCSIS